MPSSPALEMRAGAAALPRALRAWPTTSRSMLHSGTGRAAWVAQSCGSRGVPRERRWSKVRAAASRCVNASPSPHTLRRVAISEVWRYSSLYTDPGSTHGETRIAGTR